MRVITISRELGSEVTSISEIVQAISLIDKSSLGNADYSILINGRLPGDYVIRCIIKKDSVAQTLSFLVNAC